MLWLSISIFRDIKEYYCTKIVSFGSLLDIYQNNDADLSTPLNINPSANRNKAVPSGLYGPHIPNSCYRGHPTLPLAGKSFESPRRGSIACQPASRLPTAPSPVLRVAGVDWQDHDMRRRIRRQGHGEPPRSRSPVLIWQLSKAVTEGLTPIPPPEKWMQ